MVKIDIICDMGKLLSKLIYHTNILGEFYASNISLFTNNNNLIRKVPTLAMFSCFFSNNR